MFELMLTLKWRYKRGLGVLRSELAWANNITNMDSSLIGATGERSFSRSISSNVQGETKRDSQRRHGRLRHRFTNLQPATNEKALAKLSP